MTAPKRRNWTGSEISNLLNVNDRAVERAILAIDKRAMFTPKHTMLGTELAARIREAESNKTKLERIDIERARSMSRTYIKDLVKIANTPEEETPK